MTPDDRAKARDQLRALEAASADSPLRDDLHVLGDAISVGDISNAVGVVIGRNIRLVVNHFDVPPEAAGALLDLRAMLGTALELDTVQYQWGNLVADKTRDFVGRDYVFQAIDRFLTANASGYLTIAGDPGTGKSSILAEYVLRTGCIAHFNVRGLGITTASQFLQNICAQLIADANLPYQSLPENAARDGAFLLKLLHEATARLAPGDRMVIAIDALDEVDVASQPHGSNVLFLPATLPDGVYFLTTQRNATLPFVAQAPQEVLDLMAHPAENRGDVESYLHHTIMHPGLATWVADHNLTQKDFVSKLADLSENNFMYLHYVLPEIERGVYQTLSIERLPRGLDGYYESHWQRMGMTARPIPRDKIRIVYILCEAQLPVSRRLVSEFATDDVMHVDEVTVQEVLDDWQQFLHKQPADDGSRYSVYHFSFRDFLHRLDIVQAAGVQIEDINIGISNNLWESLFGATELSGPDILAGHDLQPRLNQLSPEARSYAYAGLCKTLIAARQYARLDLLLTNLEFLAARVAFGGPDAAIRDYRAARVAQADAWAEDGGPAQFSRFLDRRSQFLRSAPDLVLQEAFNSSEESVLRSAANLRKAGRFPTDPWLRKLTGATEDQHTGQVIAMAFWGDERYLAVSTTEREVWVWDCLTGQVRTRCDPPPSPAKSLAVSPSGDHLAAGYGSTLPTPLQAGVLAWSPDGSVAWTRALDEWVYTVRWRSETEIIAGGGLPSGSEAIGILWKIDVAAARSTELGNWLADRPLLLTWDPVSGDAEQVMALAHDGFVLHLRPEYVAISPEEAQELSLKLMEDGDYEAHDARMVERRPIVSRICAPTTDNDGYLCTAATIGATNRICVLGERPVPPEMLMFHRPTPDGIYIFNPDDGQLGRLPFTEEAVAAGFRALCIAASPTGSTLAMGTSYGTVDLFPVSDSGFVEAPERVHKGNSPVTAICFSVSGRRLAAGDAASQIAVYDLPDGEQVIHTRHGESALAAQIDDDRHIVLFADRLQVSSSNATPMNVAVTWDDGMRAVDLARCGDLAMILCARAGPYREDLDQEAEGEQALKVVDLKSPRVLVEAPVPSISTIFAGGEEGNSAGHAFHRIALLVDNGQCRVYLGSLHGVAEFSFLAHDRYRIFALPGEKKTFALSEEETKRDPQISVIRIGDQEPDLACHIFTGSTHNGSLLCGYADNTAHPRISGELHCWDTRTSRHSAIMRFASTITAIEATRGGTVLIGTEQGEVVSLRQDGEWHQLAELHHPAEVSCVAFDEPRQMACSVSRDGLVLLWDLLDGTRILSTSMDVEPVHAAFTTEPTRLSIVDRSGQLHTWKLENRSGLGDTNAPEQNAGSTTAADKTAVVEACLRAAEQVGRAVEAMAHGDSATAAALLSDLPDGPGSAEIQMYWQAVLQSMGP